MIPVMIQAALSAASTQLASAAQGSQEKGFASILRDLIGGAENSANSGSVAAPQGLAIKNANEGPESKTVYSSNGKADNHQVQDPVEVLRQLLLQMATAAQQIVNQPDIKTPVSSEDIKSVKVIPSDQTMQASLTNAMADLAKEISQHSPAAQISSDTADSVSNQGFMAALAANRNIAADKIDTRLFDKITAGQNGAKAVLSALKGTSLADSPNAVLPPEGASKPDIGLQAFIQGGKDAASLSKTALADETFSQLRAVISSPAPETVDRGDSSKTPDICATGIQAPASSVREQSPIQETVPANRIASLDAVISKAVEAGQKNLVVRIDPPDLGSMHIRLSIDNGVLRADVRVDSNSVKDSFNLAVPQIKSSLENSGIKVSEFHVGVREDQYRSGQERNNQGQHQRQNRGTRHGFSDFFA